MMAVEKERVNVTLPKPYLDALARLVKEGIYMDRGSAIRAALRLLFASHGIPPFSGVQERALKEKRLTEKEEK